MGFIGRDPSNALQLGESNTTATDACNTDRRLTGTLVEEGSRLMPQSKPFPSFTLSQFLKSAAIPWERYESPVSREVELLKRALLYGLSCSAHDGVYTFWPDGPLSYELATLARHDRAEYLLQPGSKDESCSVEEATSASDDFRSAFTSLLNDGSVSLTWSDDCLAATINRPTSEPTVLCRAPGQMMRSANVGTVYLLRCHKRFKIGISRQFHQRFANLNYGQSPYPLETIHRATGPEYKAYERMLHQRFADKRVHSEWFLLSDDDLPGLIEEMNEWAFQIQGVSQ